MIHRMNIVPIVRDTSFSMHKFKSTMFQSGFTKSVNQSWTTGYVFYCFNINQRGTGSLRSIRVFMGPYRRETGG